MDLTFLPTGLLLLASIFLLCGLRWVSLAFGIIAAGAAFWSARIEPTGIAALVVAGALVWAGERIPSRPLRFVCLLLFLVLAVMLSNHLAPGFRNQLVFDHVRFADETVPFTMYLNFDKTFVGLLIGVFYLRNVSWWLSRAQWGTVLRTLVALLVLVIPLALLTSYVRFDPKWPPLGWMWALNNFFFVALAEEALFRGFIQEGLLRLFPKVAIFGDVALFIAAALFGFAHWSGGWSYVAFAFFAGLFYGRVYARTRQLSASMLVHFGLNLVHFALFSYPALGH